MGTASSYSPCKAESHASLERDGLPSQLLAEWGSLTKCEALPKGPLEAAYEQMADQWHFTERRLCSTRREAIYGEYHSLPAIEHRRSQVHGTLPHIATAVKEAADAGVCPEKSTTETRAQLPPAGSSLYPLPAKFRLHKPSKLQTRNRRSSFTMAKNNSRKAIH